MRNEGHGGASHGFKPEAVKNPASRGRKKSLPLSLRRFDGGRFSASGLNPWFLLLLLICVSFTPSQAADSPARQLRASYTRLDAVYSQRDVPAILSCFAPDFKRVTWNAALTPTQFEAQLKDDFDGTSSATATTRIKSLNIHGDSADAVAVRRLDWTYSQPMLDQPPPYFHVWAVQEQWRNTQGQWRMTEMSDTSLVQTLALLSARDQKIRFHAIASPKDPALAAQVHQIDAADRGRLKQIIRQYGWPGFELVGTEGELDAWEIVQHSDDDRAFQKRCLPLLQAAVAQGQASPADLALLTDRILRGEGKPQIYGTQFTTNKQGQWVPQPMEDPAHVDQRRASAGLGSLAEYAKMIQQMYHPVPRTPESNK